MTFLLFEKRLIGKFEVFEEAFRKYIKAASENKDYFFEIAEQMEGREPTLEERVDAFFLPILMNGGAW